VTETPEENTEENAEETPAEIPADNLQDALARDGIQMSAEAMEQLDAYRIALWGWNQKINLTRHTDFEKFVRRDVIDSLELAALLEPGESVLDMGTGGGVPGIIVAILRPDVQVDLCESVAKRANVVAQIVEALDLPVPVHHGRAEVHLGNQRYTSVMARAVAPLSKMLGWVSPHWDNVGRLLAVKGAKWVEERGEARHLGLMHGIGLRCVAKYKTPGLEAENVILAVGPKVGNK
jgi:16S rRNA (guanine527-N7)-methyltransferase